MATNWEIVRMPLRASIGVILLVSFGLVGSVAALWSSPADGQYRGSDRVAQSGERMAPVRSWLPAHGVVSYQATDFDRERYYLAQYYLAPLILAEDGDHSWVILDRDDPSERWQQAGHGSLTLIADPGNGVQVFRTEGE
jgi:hypothetical protein